MAATGAVALTLAACENATGATESTATTTPAATGPFAPALRIPQILKPTHTSGDTDYYALAAKTTETEILPGVRTKVLTYGDTLPGPTIKATRGRTVVLTQYNSHTEPISTHLHGGHVPVSQDGVPWDTIEPGKDRDYRYPNTQPGATLWYHDHSHMTEAEHVYRGLAGMYLLDDPAEQTLGLPTGEYDVPIMLRDAQFDDAGQLVFTMGGFKDRKTLLVNGTLPPHFEVAARKYRLRFLNSANERGFKLSLGDAVPMQIIGTDGGLVPAPITVTEFYLWPGERVEVVVDFAAHPVGTQLVLNNSIGEVDAVKSVMRFDVTRSATDASVVPAALRPALDLGAPTVERQLVFKFDLAMGMYLIDGKMFDENRIDQRIALGATEIWTIRNDDLKPSIPHNMHLHLTHFTVLDRNGKPVDPAETGPKDTVTTLPGDTVRIKVKFTENAGKTVYHCHLLDHSAMGMMAVMEITA